MSKFKSITILFNRWLDHKSQFYSRICAEPTSRRQVIYIHGVSICMLIGAVSVEQNIIVALSAALSAAWIIWHMNMNDRKQKNDL